MSISASLETQLCDGCEYNTCFETWHKPEEDCRLQHSARLVCSLYSDQASILKRAHWKCLCSRETLVVSQNKMPLVEFAPLRIPLHRRLETAAVALYYYSFFFGALIGTLIILGLFFTSYYPIAILYLSWAYLIDGRTPDHGGRRSNFVRRLRVWKYFRDYFPIKLIKTEELEPSKNYVFGYHPHGILCAGAFCNFATEATDFSGIFPGITPHLLPLMGK